jgi:hypothetical protein
MNLIRFIKFYLAFNKLSSVEKKILFLTYKETKHVKLNNKEPFTLIQQSIINPKPIIDNYKKEFYQKSVNTALNFYNLLAFFDPEDPVHFYMLVW